MELVQVLAQMLFGFGCFGFLPMVLAVVAVIDVVRVGAEWYWIPVILFFPVMGPIVYFVVVRGGSFARISPAAARRHQAKVRLRVLEVQLAHWRGPVPLAEAGEELLVLGQYPKAIAYLREAYDAEGPVAEVNYRYGMALAIVGRWKDAVPVMEELYEEDPNAKLGEARLHFARCLDEAGEKEDAEEILREVLTQRKPFEARVRLARILLGKGEHEEARQLLAEIAREATILPRYLKRDQGPWIRAARRLRSATQALPRYKVPGAFRRRPWPIVVAVAAAVLLVLLFLMAAAGYYFAQSEGGYDYDDSYYEEPASSSVEEPSAETSPEASSETQAESPAEPSAESP